MIVMNIPENCWECPETERCPAPHYGGDGCLHEEVIKSEIINATLSAKPKD